MPTQTSSSAAATPAGPPAATRPRAYRLLLSLGALGIVYGDIGTSPLYAIREAFGGHFGVAPIESNVLGVISLITWSLVLIVALKYLLIVLRADYEGEGGILALMTLATDAASSKLARRRSAHGWRLRRIFVAMGLFGAALLFGDGMLTPAISVLSAVEGLEVMQPGLATWVVPITVGILAGLFLVQRTGTAGVGRFFGPIMLVWFAAIAVLGLRGILMAPAILGALDPRHALAFFLDNGTMGILVLGAVFLVVTGAEALYADLGHFGAWPIRVDWFVVVMPALLLNYYGQGALVLSDPSTTSSPFHLLAPPWALPPLILLSTAATVIASQAIITGVFSLTAQAVQLGYWPRLQIRHTSPEEYGQIYIPAMNWILLLGSVLLVLSFRSSSALAAAYGVAIVATMVVTSMLLYVVLPTRLGWSPWASAVAVTVFLAAEVMFLTANLAKVHEGGWVSLAIAAVAYIVMTTWRDGRTTVGEQLRERVLPIEGFLRTLSFQGVVRVRGNAVYMTSNAFATPAALLMMIQHQHAVHKLVVVLTIENVRTPHVHGDQRVTIEDLGSGFHRVIARYGFMEAPDVPRILVRMRERGLRLDLKDTTFFLGRERLMTSGASRVARWRMGLFSFLSRNSQRATAFFNIPSDRVVEVGSQLEVGPRG